MWTNFCFVCCQVRAEQYLGRSLAQGWFTGDGQILIITIRIIVVQLSCLFMSLVFDYKKIWSIIDTDLLDNRQHPRMPSVILVSTNDQVHLVRMIIGLELCSQTIMKVSRRLRDLLSTEHDGKAVSCEIYDWC